MATSIQRMFFRLKGRLQIVTRYDKLAGTFVVGDLPCRSPLLVDLVESDRGRWCRAAYTTRRLKVPQRVHWAAR
jgi:hypothetical protein